MLTFKRNSFGIKMTIFILVAVSLIFLSGCFDDNSPNYKAFDKDELAMKYFAGNYKNYTNEPNGFEGITWGSHIRLSQEILKRTDKNGSEVSFDFKPEHKPEWLKPYYTNLVFESGYLVSASVMSFSKESSAELFSHVMSLYGPPQYESDDSFYSWDGYRTRISVLLGSASTSVFYTSTVFKK